MASSKFAAPQRRNFEHRLEFQSWRLVRFLSCRRFRRFLIRSVIVVQRSSPCSVTRLPHSAMLPWQHSPISGGITEPCKYKSGEGRQVRTLWGPDAISVNPLDQPVRNARARLGIVRRGLVSRDGILRNFEEFAN